MPGILILKRITRELILYTILDTILILTLPQNMLV